MDWRSDGIIATVLDPGWVKTDMGGKNAPTPPEHSVAGMRQVIAALTLAQSGKFLRWNGGERAW